MSKCHKVEWEEITRAITGAIAEGMPVWQAIEGMVGCPGDVQGTVDGRFPEWSVPVELIEPRRRRSTLDYAEVREVGAHCSSWQRAAPWRPGRSPPAPQDGARAGMEIIDVRIAIQRPLVQDVTPEMVARDGGNVIRDVLASMRDEILLDVEALVRERLAAAGEKGGLGYDLYLENTRERGSYDRVFLEARHILEAGRSVATACPHASFPRGLFCLLSPSQALQLLRKGGLDARSMSVCGIDAVVSQLPGRRADIEARSAMVAVKGSVSVAMSKIRIRMTQDGGVCGVEAGYDMGAEIVPRMTARLVTEQGAGDRVRHG